MIPSLLKKELYWNNREMLIMRSNVYLSSRDLFLKTKYKKIPPTIIYPIQARCAIVPIPKPYSGRNVPKNICGKEMGILINKHPKNTGKNMKNSDTFANFNLSVFQSTVYNPVPSANKFNAPNNPPLK